MKGELFVMDRGQTTNTGGGGGGGGGGGVPVHRVSNRWTTKKAT